MLKFPLLFLYFAVITRVAWVCYSKPAYNWDTLAYMAIVLNADNSNLSEVHQKTYALAKQEMPTKSFALLTDTTSAIRKAVLESHQSFFQYMSFFRIKPLYNICAYLAYRSGVAITKAVVLPSIIAYFWLGVLLVFWLKKYYPWWIATATSACVILSPPLIEAARLATPDALSTLILLLFFWILTEGYDLKYALIILLISVLIRIDNLIFVWVAGTFLFFFAINLQNKMLKLLVILDLIVSTAIALFVFYHASYQNGFENFYGGLSQKANPMELLKGIVIGFNTLQTSHLSIVVSFAAVILFFRNNNIKEWQATHYCFLILITYASVKFIFFPDFTTRLFLIVYVGSVVLALIALAQKPAQIGKTGI